MIYASRLKARSHALKTMQRKNVVDDIKLGLYRT